MAKQLKMNLFSAETFRISEHQCFKGYFTSRHEKRPKLICGLDGIDSLKRLFEKIA